MAKEMHLFGRYFTLSEVDRLKVKLGKKGIKILAVKKERAGFPTFLTVHAVYTDIHPRDFR